MSQFVFTDPNTGQEFTVTAPSGVTEDQARSIFQQQLGSGSLAGVNVGSVISAATQSAGGLAGAQAMLNQTLGSLSGKLPSTASLNTITSSLGATGLAGASQLTNSLIGTSAGIPATSLGSLSSLASSSFSSASRLVTQAGSALTGAAAAAGSLASKAVSSIASSFGGTVTNGINVSDLVKQGTSIGLPDLGATNVQAAMSQAAKLVGQPHTVISNTLGVGKFGLDLPQLETAGIVKPGLASTAAAAGASLTSVLSSPTAFTGKLGIKNLDGLLASETAQNNIQQGLMGSGLDALKTVGVPVGNLNPKAVAGLANNAAKSLTNTLDSLKGTAPADVKAKFDEVTRDSAYAVDFTETKVDPEVLGIVTAEPAENTVNDETLVAAIQRIVGNNKVFVV